MHHSEMLLHALLGCKGPVTVRTGDPPPLHTGRHMCPQHPSANQDLSTFLTGEFFLPCALPYGALACGES